MPKRHNAGHDARRVVARIEERLVASSGANPFEVVFALAAARALGSGADDVAARLRELGAIQRRWPILGLVPIDDVPRPVLEEVDRLLGHVLPRAPRSEAREDGRASRRTGSRSGEDGTGEALDALFEVLAPRVGKGEKGQFFTPRHVVDLAVRALRLRPGERVVDPACGSGAFLVHARRCADVAVRGTDVDPRAVRVAQLLALATGGDPSRIAHADGLRRTTDDPADVVATNPPFAGEVDTAGFELASLGRRTERDALFLERSLDLLRPAGRLAIVLPHNKVAGRSWAPLRSWLVARARIFAVISLPARTFAPHTTQRTVLVLARRRAAREKPDPENEAIFFAVSERSGKTAGGEPQYRPDAATNDWRALDHDLEPIAEHLLPFLAAQGYEGHRAKHPRITS